MTAPTATLRRLERDLGALVSRHERARDLSEFSVYSSDPLGFIRDVLGSSPWSRQVEIVDVALFLLLWQFRQRGADLRYILVADCHWQ